MYEQPTIPTGFVEVTRERFYQLVELDGEALDPMPTTEHPYCGRWYPQKGPRVLWGWKSEGWRTPSTVLHQPGYKVTYAVRDSVAARWEGR